MTDRLDRFELQLTSAIARRSRKSRRRRTVCVATAAAVTVTAGAGAAGDSLDPLGLFDAAPAMKTDGPMRPTGATRLALRSEANASARWSIAIYPAKESLCGGVATVALPRPSVICQGSFPIAQQLEGRAVRVLPSASILGPSSDRRVDVLVYGFADGDVGELRVQAGGQDVGTLAGTDGSIRVRVDRDNPDLTSEGRATAALLPDELDLHLVATSVTVTRAESRSLRVTSSTGAEVPVSPPSE